MTIAQMLDRLDELATFINDGVDAHRTSCFQVAREIRALVKQLRAASKQSKLL